MIVARMSGVGGLNMTNYVAKVAPKDGTAIGGRGARFKPIPILPSTTDNGATPGAG